MVCFVAMTHADATPDLPTADDYRSDYFTTLYGAAPAQTVADRFRDRLLRALVRRYHDPGRLLEVGCGFGYFLQGFDRTWALHGTDISAHAARVASARLPHAHVVAADVQDGIPFGGMFDVIVAVNVMEHLPEPRRGMQAISDHLRTGGIFVAHLPTISSPLAAWFYERSYARDITHVYRPSGAAFNALAQSTGMETLWSSHFPFYPPALWNRLRPHPSYLAVFRKTTTDH
jgi:SAM-dependent methyltransferase